LGKRLGGEFALTRDDTGARKNRLEELAKLKHAALAELERRGYEVRGKTPGQIRKLLKRRPKKPKGKAFAALVVAPTDSQ